jgi:multidrug efflux system membrane fusion protein
VRDRLRLATRLAIALLLAVPLAASLHGCESEGSAADKPGPGGGRPGNGPGKRGGPTEFPVEVQKVTARDVQYQLTAVGSVDAYDRVQMTARVAGVIERVRFAEGQHVKEGQVLAEIEPQRFQVAVRAAEAALARARASKADAEAGIARREQALAQSPGLIPAEELQTFRTKLSLAEAEALSAQASYDQAALNRRDAYVRAPISGTIETRTAQTGQYAQPGTVLGTLVQRDPLLLRFQVPETDAGKLAHDQVVGFAVRGQDRRFSAKITHIAAVADPASRMVPVIAEVADDDGEALRPGSFAEVSAGIAGGGRAPVVPETSVRPSERGFIAYVVEGDVVRERVLTLGMHTSDGHVEVKAGLREGESLVFRGAEALRDNAKIKIVTADSSGGGRKGQGEGKPERGGAP